MNPEKISLRTRLLAAREACGPLDEASAAVSRRLRTLPELATVRVILGYAATSQEVSIDTTLEALLSAGVTVCLPWVDGPTLGVGAIDTLDDLAPGWRGVREPRADRRRQLRPTALDAVIAPGVGFDRAGNRLGYGGGHFDRLLARVQRDTVVIGVALDEQIVTAVPAESHDRPVDVIVTPTNTIRPQVP